MAKISKVGTRGTGGVYVDHAYTPIFVHMMLAVWRFYNHAIEVRRVLAMSEKEGPIVQTHGAATDDQSRSAGYGRRDRFL